MPSERNVQLEAKRLYLAAKHDIAKAIQDAEDRESKAEKRLLDVSARSPKFEALDEEVHLWAAVVELLGEWAYESQQRFYQREDTPSLNAPWWEGR